jgi:DNA-binding NarL/FixJ family response regulator
MKQEQTRLLIVGDFANSPESLAILLERKRDLLVVGYTATSGAARALLATGIDIDVALVELDLPDGSGLELTRNIRQSRPTALVVMLMNSHDAFDWTRAVEAGARLVLHKTLHGTEIIDVIHRLRSVEPPLSRYDAFALMRRFGEERKRGQPTNENFAHLTRREREILVFLADGLSDREIAARLYVSEKTVRNHMTALLAKLGVESRLQALVLAIRHGVITIH